MYLLVLFAFTGEPSLWMIVGGLISSSSATLSDICFIDAFIGNVSKISRTLK